MIRRIHLVAVLSSLGLVTASCGAAPAGESAGTVAAAGQGLAITDHGTFDEPWALAFLPGTDIALVTEKGGALKLWQKGHPVREVAGVPKVDYGGQGGFGDAALSPRYAEDGLVYLTWVQSGPGDTRGAVLGRARLVLDGAPRLEGLRIIWWQSPTVTGSGHYSHRIAFSPDGQYLFLASGERQKKTPAQDLSNNLGKVLRLLPDGSAAPGNPFADRGGTSAQIWSHGHRNALGLQFDAAGRLWDLEHGPQGGDEINLVEPGRNYGWPLVSNGDNYDGSPIPRHATRPDLAAPAISWNPVIAPGDFIFYSGDLFPDWKGQAIIAAMAYPGLVRVAIDGTTAREVERIDLGTRIREVRQGPDGALWVLEDGDGGRLRRIAPK